MKRRIFIITMVVALLCISMFAGCKNSKQDDGKDNNSSTETSQNTEDVSLATPWEDNKEADETIKASDENTTEVTIVSTAAASSDNATLAAGETPYVTADVNKRVKTTGEAAATATPDAKTTAVPGGYTAVSKATVTPAPTATAAPTATPVATPTVTFSKSAGIYLSSFELTLSAPEGYTIYYTKNGSDPIKTSAIKYTGPITIKNSEGNNVGTVTSLVSANLGYRNPSSQMIGQVIRAYAVKGGQKTEVVTASYFVSTAMLQTYNMKSINISINTSEFATSSGIYVDVMNHPFDSKEKKTCYVEFFDENGVRQTSQYAKLSMHGNGSLGQQMKSFRLFFSEDAESSVTGNPKKLYYDVFEGRCKTNDGETITEYKRLVLRNSGNDALLTMMRDAFCQRMASNLNCDYLESEPALIFINGEFWGMYNIRERYDAKYFKAHYGIDDDNIVILEAPTPLADPVSDDYTLCEGEEGDEQDFYDLVNYIKNHDLSNDTYYNYVCKKLDEDSLIDYLVTNLYFVNYDWPGNNVKVWRNKDANDESGMDTKWRFALLDLDFCCAGSDTASPTANNFSLLDGQDSVLSTITSGLLENQTFRDKFYNRAKYIAENEFTKEKMKSLFTEMKNERLEAIKLNDARWNTGTTDADRTHQFSLMSNFISRRQTYFLMYLRQYFNK